MKTAPNRARRREQFRHRVKFHHTQTLAAGARQRDRAIRVSVHLDRLRAASRFLGHPIPVVRAAPGPTESFIDTLERVTPQYRPSDTRIACFVTATLLGAKRDLDPRVT